MLLLIKPDAFSDDQHNSSVEVCIQYGRGFKGLKLGDWFARFSLFLYCTLHFSLFLFCTLHFSLFLFCTLGFSIFFCMLRFSLLLFCTLGFSIFLFCMLCFTLLLFCMHSFSLSLQLEQQKKVHCHNFTELKKQQTWQRTWHLYFYFLHSVNLFCYAPNFSALFALLELCWTFAIVWKALWFGSNKKSCCHNSGGPDALCCKNNVGATVKYERGAKCAQRTKVKQSHWPWIISRKVFLILWQKYLFLFLEEALVVIAD